MVPIAKIKCKLYKSKPMPVYAVFKNADWAWFVLSKIPKTTNIVQMTLCTSPIVPQGELGSIYKEDLLSMERCDNELKDLLPATCEIVQ